MANIKVNHSEITRAADAFDEYAAKHRSRMKSVGSEISSLGSAWQGKDYAEVSRQWDEMSGRSSTSGKMLDAVESYAEYLRYCASRYKRAQSDAISRANRLPK